MVMALLALTACAPRTPLPEPDAAPPILAAEDLELVAAPSGPTAQPVTAAPPALAPILRSREVLDCEPASPLCMAVACDVENRMASGFPTRWTFSLSADDRTVRENVRWIIAPQSQERRVVPLPLATFTEATCNATGGVQTTARSTACDGLTECVDVVCSVWSNGPATTAYVDVHLAVHDGTRFDYDAVPIDVPAGGEVNSVVFRYTPDADTWHAGRPGTPQSLDLEGRCAYWQGDTPVEPLP